MKKIKIIDDWRDIIEGDTLIINRKDNNYSDDADWNILIGQRLELLEIMDMCESEGKNNR